MPFHFDSVVSGHDELIFESFHQAEFALWEIQTLGGETKELDYIGSDHYLRVGWFSICYYGDAIGPAAAYWDEPIYFNMANGRHVWGYYRESAPVPWRYISGVRWALNPGSSVRLAIYGPA